MCLGKSLNFRVFKKVRLEKSQNRFSAYERGIPSAIISLATWGQDCPTFRVYMWLETLGKDAPQTLQQEENKELREAGKVGKQIQNLQYRQQPQTVYGDENAALCTTVKSWLQWDASFFRVNRWLFIFVFLVGRFDKPSFRWCVIACFHQIPKLL